MSLASLQPTVDWWSGLPALQVTYFTGFSCGDGALGIWGGEKGGVKLTIVRLVIFVNPSFFFLVNIIRVGNFCKP